jgi:hypothetical protein
MNKIIFFCRLFFVICFLSSVNCNHYLVAQNGAAWTRRMSTFCHTPP